MERPSGPAVAVCAVVATMAAFLIAVAESVLMFQGGSISRFMIVFLIAWAICFALAYLYVADLAQRVARREEAEARLAQMSPLQLTLMAIGVLVLAVLWVVRNFSWL